MKIKQITLLLFAMLSLVGFAQTQYNSLLKETPGLVSYTLRNEFAKDVPTTLDKLNHPALKVQGFIDKGLKVLNIYNMGKRESH